MVCRGSCSPARISFACVLRRYLKWVLMALSRFSKASERNLLLSGNQSVNQHQGLWAVLLVLRRTPGPRQCTHGSPIAPAQL